MSTSYRPTSADVATRAGVSRATVSYVLNQTPRQTITAATRERVLRAAQELGYTTVVPARQRQIEASRTLLVIIDSYPVPAAVMAMLDRVTAWAAERRMCVLTWADDGTPTALDQALAAVRPAAAISFRPICQTAAEVLRSREVPLIDGASGPRSKQLERFQSRQWSIGAVQAEHLLERGHTRLAMIGSSEASRALYSTGRYQGMLETCRRAGLRDPELVEVDGRSDQLCKQLRAALTRWTTADDPVTAVAAHNDVYAAWMLRACSVLGIAVPEKLAIIGVDDEPLAALLSPPLTSVQQDMLAWADHLLDRVGAVLDATADPLQPASMRLRVVARATT